MPTGNWSLFRWPADVHFSVLPDGQVLQHLSLPTRKENPPMSDDFQHGDTVEMKVRGKVYTNPGGTTMKIQTDDDDIVVVPKRYCTRVAPVPELAPIGEHWVVNDGILAGVEVVKVAPGVWYELGSGERKTDYWMNVRSTARPKKS